MVHNVTTAGPTPQELARLGLDVLPRLMRLVAAAAGHREGEGLMGLTQFRVLKRLASRPWLGSELAQELRVSPPTISAAIDSLVRKGLVERGETAEDRRMVPLRLTPAGVRCFQATQARALAELAQVMERIQPDDRAALARGLQAVARAMEPASPCPRRSGPRAGFSE